MKDSPATRGRTAKIGLALLGLYLIWGSTYLAIRFAIDTLPPFLMAGVRFLIPGAGLLFWSLARGAARPNAGLWKTAAISGVLMFMGGNGAVVWAEQFVPSGMVALLVATVPIWIVLQDWASAKGGPPGAGVVFGILWGFCGVALLVAGPEIGLAGWDDLLGGLLVLGGAFCWAAGSLVARYGARPDSHSLGIGMQMLAGGAALLLLSLVRGEPWSFHLHAVSATSVLAVVYLMVFGSVVGFSSYIWLIRNVTPAVASTYAYVNPAVALLLGWALVGEPLSGRTGLAAFIILSSVVVIVTRRSRGNPPRRNA